MKTISLLCLLALMPIGGFAAQAELFTRAMNRDRLGAEFRTVIEPFGAGTSWHSGVQVASDGIFHRYILDTTQKVYVGYDARIRESADRTAVVLTIEPFTLGPDALPVDDPADWRSIPLIDEPRSQTLKPLESVALDLLVNHGTGQKVVDYITVGRDLNRIDRSREKRGEPRPFKAEEAEMEMQSPAVKINGTQAFRDGTLTVRGVTLGLYMKKRGRFLFSLLPHEELGFQRAGWVSGSTLEFEWAGDKYQIACNERIAPGSRSFHLYVFHDPAYQDDQEFYIFGAGNASEVLRGESR